ncbi:MAG: hypothetical protein J6O71_05700 [Lachnospiraceae bacterium]|nr:hypothetical protein [Lachnospiraceae bacterium]
MKGSVFSTKTGIYALGLIGSAIYLSLIFNNNLWVDEAFTACMIRSSFVQMLRQTFSDTLPPLYNVFTWVLTRVFGYSPYIMKLSSALPMLLLMLWLSPRYIARLCGDRAAALFTVCIICAPHLLHYGVEIRPYSWGLFFTTSAGVFALEILTSEAEHVKKAHAGFVLFSVLAGYTHQYALIPCAFLWLMLLLAALRLTGDKKLRLRTFFTALGVFFLLYLPMLVLTVYQLGRASGYFSMEALSLRSLLSDLRFPYVTNITPVSLLLMAAVLILFIFAVISSFKSIRFAVPALLITIPYLTLCFGYVCSFISGGSVFTARYLIPSLGLLWLGAAMAAGDSEGLFPAFCPGIFTLILSASLISVYTQEFAAEYAPGVNTMTAYMDENLKAGDGYVIYEDKYQIELCMRYYYPSLKKYDWETAGECSGQLWYFAVPGYENYLKEASKYGYKSEFVSNMSFDQYSFSLYKLVK